MLTRLRCFRLPHWVRGAFGGVSVRQGWGVVLMVWSAMVLLLRQVFLSCIMSVVMCSLVFMVGLLRRIHA